MTRRSGRAPGDGHRRRRVPRAARRRARCEAAGADEIFVPRSADYDLRTARRRRRGALADGRPDVVIHLAAVVGGIGANRENPGRFFYENAIMGIQLMEAGAAGRRREVRPDRHRLLLPEVHARPLPRGRPLGRLPGGDERALRPGQEDAARPGAGVPRAVRLQRHLPDPGQPVRPGRQLRPGLVARHPGADQEVRRGPRAPAPTTSRSGAPGRRRASSCTSTTRPTGIVLAAERYDGAEPVNLGVGQEITIRDLVELIVELTGFKGEIRWDADQAGRPAAARARHEPRARAVRLRGARRPSRTGCARRSTPMHEPSCGQPS